MNDRLGGQLLVLVANLAHFISHCPDERLKTDVGDRRNEERPTVDVIEVGHCDIGLRPDDEPRTSQEVRPVRTELGKEHLELGGGWRFIVGSEIEQHHKNAGSLNVAQELVTEAPPLARAFDEAGNVGHDEVESVVGLHDSQVRGERGELVVGDLRLRGRDARDQRRLASVRKADERDVGEQLELELQPGFFALLALFGEGRSAALVREEASIPAAALATGRSEVAVAVIGEVGEDLAVAAANDRANGHRGDEVVATAAMFLLPGTVFAALTFAVRVIAVAEQRRHVMVRFNPHAAAVAAIAAIGAASFHHRFTPKRHTARAAAAALHVDLALVDKLHWPILGV